MQFDQQADGTRKPLPKPSIDTGMGLERMAAVLQGVHNNYEIDLFQKLIAAEQEVYGRQAKGDQLASFRVIADHLRTSAFLVADGVTPSNEGRGYVLRRIMRRAMRHAHILGAREPSMHRLVGALSDEMGAAYPELVRAGPAIENALKDEEARFQRTLGRGLALLEEASAGLGKGDTLPGETAFKLYDTFGFPIDLTEDILRGRGMKLDEAGFDAAMQAQKTAAREAWSGSGDAGSDEAWFRVRGKIGATQFSGYDSLQASTAIAAIMVEGNPAETAQDGQKAELVFALTPFYAESGGQAGDHGLIELPSGGQFIVHDVVKRGGDLHVHAGEFIGGGASVGDEVSLSVDADRRSRVMANHSVTHLLHAALRDVLGAHVTQKGSLVEADRLRFDFSHNAPVSAAELAAVEAQVNAVIRQNQAVSVAVMAPDKAIEAGALALFGEKYGDEVRVLSMGQGLTEKAGAYSVELCGGTHVSRTGDIGVFVIMSEGGVSSGVRRIEAATGADALAFLGARAQVAVDLSAQLKVPLSDVARKVASLSDERKTLERQLAETKRALALAGEGGAPSGPENINGINLMARIADGVGGKDLRALVDEAKAQMGSGIAVFIGVNEGKAAVAVGVSKDLVERFSAVDLVKVAAEAVGGKGGGGRPDMAQAGGPDGTKAQAALDAVRAFLAG